MREILDLLLEAVNDGPKIDRSAFLYLPPKSPDTEFAQCSTCENFIPGARRCRIFSPTDRVQAEASCGLYLHGTPSDAQKPESIVTPEQAGYVNDAVRCENCSWHDGSECGLYKTLMQKLPEVFDLATEVDDYGCCNAFQAAEPKSGS